MALFSRKKNQNPQDDKDVAGKVSANTAKPSVATVSSRSVILGPRLTEKSILLNDKNVYGFMISRDASKTEVKEAIKDLYGVTPISVNVASVPTKIKRRQGRPGRTPRGRKAYVTLKKGDTIELA